MKNPAAISQPKLTTPIGNGNGKGKRGKGNLPYLRFRRRMRKDVFGKAL